ncbi:unnamed protein product [Amoebophrya sp. A120]|nr:unnamed protein product [Amoebophrya sp. A120]|eukprot:GSA120T00024049001.1
MMAMALRCPPDPPSLRDSHLRPFAQGEAKCVALLFSMTNLEIFQTETYLHLIGGSAGQHRGHQDCSRPGQGPGLHRGKGGHHPNTLHPALRRPHRGGENQGEEKLEDGRRYEGEKRVLRVCGWERRGGSRPRRGRARLVPARESRNIRVPFLRLRVQGRRDSNTTQHAGILRRGDMSDKRRWQRHRRARARGGRA